MHMWARKHTKMTDSLKGAFVEMALKGTVLVSLTSLCPV